MKKISLLIPFVFLILIASAFAELQITQGPTFSQNSYSIGGGGKVTSFITLKNIGTTKESGIIELQLTQTPINSALSFVTAYSQQTACNPQTKWNRHADYILNPGESANFQLGSDYVPDGKYYAYLVHVTGCCTDGVNNLPCSAKQPFGWGTQLNNGIQFTIGNNAPSSGECSQDSQALQIVRQKGASNCIEARCNNANTPQATATCTKYGECYTGTDQTTTCDDGSIKLVRKCENSQWVETGKECTTGTGGSSDGEIPDKPKPVPDNSENPFADLQLNTFAIILGVLGIGLLGLQMVGIKSPALIILGIIFILAGVGVQFAL